MPLPLLLSAVEGLPSFDRLLDRTPPPDHLVRVAGLHGSSDAVLVCALSRRLERRFFVVVCDAVPEAERWLADMAAVADEGSVAFYPPREAFGEAEPHAEVAGERVETLERMARGGIRVLLTTARAVMERTRLARALSAARLELRKGDVRRLEDLIAHLESIGFERVDMVDDVAQFSVR